MPEAATPVLVPAPAYAQLVARRPYLWGGRRLAEGDVVLDLRARGGAADVKVFADLLRWGAFKVQPVAGPPATPGAPAGPTVADAMAMAERIAVLEQELATRPKVLSTPAAAMELRTYVPDRSALVRLLAELPAGDLIGLPGIGVKKAEEIQAWAKDELPNLPPMLPLLPADTQPQA